MPTEKTYTNISEGVFTQQETVLATANRNIHTFEVLDYDIYKENYALIYKDVLITHEQIQNYARTNTPGGIYYQYLFSNGDMPASALLLHNDTSNFISIGTRVITYKLHYKVEGEVFSVDLATCTITNNMSVYTMIGERLYGVSIQASDKFIAYSFEKHTANLGSGIGYPYDSPRNLEDWNVNQLGESIWTRSKQVVGLININDGAGSDRGYLKQEEYDILIPEQYAVGIVTAQ